MNWITDEFLFIIGISIASAALIIGLVSFVVYKIKKEKLKAIFEKEYGEDT